METSTSQPAANQPGPTILVAGAGAAGLVAAIRAHQLGATVSIVEKGSPADVGGNARFSGGLFLFSHGGTADVRELVEFDPDRVSVAAYPAPAYTDAIMTMSSGRAEPAMVGPLVEHSLAAMHWLRDAGVEFQLSSGVFGTYQHGDLQIVPPGPALEATGGGEGLVEALLAEVARRSIEIRYDCALEEIDVLDGAVTGAVVGSERAHQRCDALVLTTGGFEANPVLRRRYLGPEWGPVKTRGTRHNTGEPLLAALGLGAAASGDFSQCHSISVDANAADVPGLGQPTPARLSRGFRYGILLNADGERFFDEGEDLWTRIYSKMGRALLAQPGAAGYHLFDAKVSERVRAAIPGVVPIQADTLDAVARRAGIDPEGLQRTVQAFNDAVTGTSVDFDGLDGNGTAGITPPKSNWALRIDQPPFLVYPASCGITFTHGGLAIDDTGRVLAEGGAAIAGLYAAGEITGGLFYGNYPGGSSLMRSTVFGLRAATAAVQDATRAN